MNINVGKRTSRHVSPTKTQIYPRISAIWLEYLLSTWRDFAALAVQKASREDSDLTARTRMRMRSQIWIFPGRIRLKVLFWCYGSNDPVIWQRIWPVWSWFYFYCPHSPRRHLIAYRSADNDSLVCSFNLHLQMLTILLGYQNDSGK